jgi:hypothetical protein
VSWDDVLGRAVYLIKYLVRAKILISRLRRDACLTGSMIMTALRGGTGTPRLGNRHDHEIIGTTGWPYPNVPWTHYATTGPQARRREDTSICWKQERVGIWTRRTFKSMNVLSACDQFGMVLDILFALLLSRLGSMENGLFDARITKIACLTMIPLIVWIEIVKLTRRVGSSYDEQRSKERVQQ